MSYWSRGNDPRGDSYADCDSIEEEENMVDNNDYTAKFAPKASASRRAEDQSMAIHGD